MARTRRGPSIMMLGLVLTLVGSMLAAAGPALAGGKHGPVRVPKPTLRCTYSGRMLTALTVRRPHVSMDKRLARRGLTEQYVGIQLTLQGEYGSSWKSLQRRPARGDYAVTVLTHPRRKTPIPAGHRRMLTFRGAPLTGYSAYRVKLKLTWYAYDGRHIRGKVKRVLGPACAGQLPGPPPSVVRIDAGYGFGCALMSDQSARCWGAGGNGRLGDGSTANQPRPVVPKGMVSGVRSLAVGRASACSVSTHAEATCWGANADGELGDGTRTTRVVPTPVKNLGGASAVWLDTGATCGLSGSQLKCWGVNNHGQVGNKGTTDVLTPRAVSGRTNIVSVGSGASQTCSVGPSGGLYCWGADNYQQMQVSPATSTLYGPRAMSGVAGASSVTSGAGFTCAVVAGGAAKCWGADYDYQLGNGTTTTSAKPVTPTGLGSGVTTISAFGNSSCAVKGGAVYCWGANSSGQLGTGDTVTVKTPRRVDSLTGITGVAVGSTMTYAWDAAGDVWAWGANTYGQLATGDTTAHLTPISVSIH